VTKARVEEKVLHSLYGHGLPYNGFCGALHYLVYRFLPRIVGIVESLVDDCSIDFQGDPAFP